MRHRIQGWTHTARQAMDRIPDEVASLFAALDRRLGGVPSVIRGTLEAYGRHSGGLAAAAIAYYCLLYTSPSPRDRG